jgi:hypothetical protein
VSRPASNPHAPRFQFPCALARPNFSIFVSCDTVTRLSEPGPRNRRFIVVLYFLHMDKDTKDILEAVNFIKDRMATKDDLADLRNEMHDGFAAINRRLDHIIQMQLDEHATRIKKLETAVFSK